MKANSEISVNKLSRGQQHTSALTPFNIVSFTYWLVTMIRSLELTPWPPALPHYM
jgi:hypothetical protein